MTVADELVARFDAAGTLVGACRRSVMRRDNVWHAASSIVVRGPSDSVYLHRRTLSKDVFPGLLDFAAGGVVLAGEDPVAGARRELDEELGVGGVELVPLGVVTYADHHTRYHAHRFMTTWSGVVRWQPEEVAWGDWVPLQELVRRIGREPRSFVPDSVAVWLPVLRRWALDENELG
ncbi:MAG TPA: NUDIX domain-containing protein [Intrasporangium sp.]|nr:NUDIX domain-containing protein [Intrasporangium sp.]